jgi:thiamine-phosphate pyrophosphorylase
MEKIGPQLATARLYGIVDLGYVSESAAPDIARRMLEGGVDVVQLRAKQFSPSRISALARLLVPICQAGKVPFLINDHPELVSDTGADGAHVGQDDMTVAQARTLAGPGALIGKSTHSQAQALASLEESPDYIGFGPLFATPTKAEYAPIGLTDIGAVHGQVALPIFCIGGIKRENLSNVLSAGAKRVVIVSGILQAEDVVAYCRECRAQLSSILD